MSKVEIEKKLREVEARVYKLYMHTESEFQDIGYELRCLIDAI